MAYMYEKWTLYKQDIKLKHRRDKTIYFFTKRKPKRGTPSDMPMGYRVKEATTKGSGMPYVTKH